MSSTSRARQRIQTLLDANSFVEVGALVQARSTDFNMASARKPSDGVITGYGLIDGSLVYVYSQDADVLGGSIGEMHAKKIAGLYRMAIRMGAPVIGLIDSAGMRLQEGVDALNAFAEIYAAKAAASGIIPQICAIFGKCGGGLALFPALSDFSFMEKDAHLFVNAPNAIAGNHEERNDTSTAAKKAGAGDIDFVGTEEEILAQIRMLAGLLPSNNEDDSDKECEDDMNRSCLQAAASVADPRTALLEIVDSGTLFETKQEYGKGMFTGLARLGGMTVGFVANRPVPKKGSGAKNVSDGSALSTRGCRKAARLVRFCDAFDIPVVSLTNVEGFAAKMTEENTVAAAAAGLVAAFAGATVPKVNVITKRAGGSAYAIMNSRALGADLTLAYQGASIGILPGKYAAQVLCDGAPEEVRQAAKDYDAMQNSIDAAAARGYVDQIIAPEDVRKYLIGAIEMLYSKREALPSRKHASF